MRGFARSGATRRQYHNAMRNKLLLAALAIVAGAACDPTIHSFKIEPTTLQCPGNVTLTWKASDKGVHLNADEPVVPPTPAILPKEGTRQELVSNPTEFSLYFPGAGHREISVIVTGGKNCGGGTGPGTCGPSTLTFHGQCTSANMGPSYDTQSISAAAGPGAITMLLNDADFPVHVFHAGQEIGLGAGGGPVFPLPPGIPAAGSYTITVPGQPGLLICKDAGPTNGTVDAPPITIHVTPTCPKP
jgi:hypothetical protein